MIKHLYCYIFIFLIFSGTKAQTSKPIITFGVVADCQYDKNLKSTHRFYSHSIYKIEEAIKHYNKSDISCIISLGDIIDRDIEALKEISTILEKAKAPIFHTLGNHDYLDTDTSSLQQKVFDLLKIKATYYSFTKKGVRFIVLDGNDISTFANAPNHKNHKRALCMLDSLKKEKKTNAYRWNSAISNKQLAWLDSELKRAKKQNNRVLIFIHQPLLPENSGERLWNSGVLISAIEKYDNVKAVFSGHDHKGGYNFKNGIHFFTIKGMVESAKNTFEIVELHQNSLCIQSFGDTVKKRYFEFGIPFKCDQYSDIN